MGGGVGGFVRFGEGRGDWDWYWKDGYWDWDWREGDWDWDCCRGDRGEGVLGKCRGWKVSDLRGKRDKGIRV